MTGHKTRAHALLSASGSHKWLHCTPSARAEEAFPEEAVSEYAEEGTRAHEAAEAKLRAFLKIGPDYVKGDDTEKETATDVYVEYVKELYSEAKRRSKDAAIRIEARLDFSEYVEEGYGTGDCCIVSDGILDVIDYKHGKGVKVEVEGNPQLMLYGLGALRAYDLAFDIVLVRLHIVQPRIDHIAVAEVLVEDLKRWGDEVVRPAAIDAYAGTGERCAGDWCRWCKASPRCKAIADLAAETAKLEFAQMSELSDVEMVEIFNRSGIIKTWLDGVSSYMLKEALSGKSWPGLKVVEGRSVRKWADEAAVVTALRNECYADDEITVTKVKGITEIEKLLGKKPFETILGRLTVKPQGSPTLVDESDKRQPFKPNDAKEDFK